MDISDLRTRKSSPTLIRIDRPLISLIRGIAQETSTTMTTIPFQRAHHAAARFSFFLLAVLVLQALPLPAAADNAQVADTVAVEDSLAGTPAHPGGSTAAHGDTTAEHGGTAAGHEGAGGHGKIGTELPLWSCIPFAGILLSIALFPLFAPRWWHHHFPKVSAFWAVLLAVPFLIVYRSAAFHEILHIYFLDYFPFIILLWALFTVAAGIHVRGRLHGTPELNVLFLLIGTSLASWVGTTGASMIMIRPVLRANAWRRYKVHLCVFFIFLVSNIGGSLTPLGDPPLFLGFLHGVPFFWTFHLLSPMLVVAIPLLIMFYLVDRLYFRREEQPEETGGAEAVRVDGLHNLLFLAGVVGAVLMSGTWKIGTFELLGVELKTEFVLRDGLLILLGILSLVTTHKDIYTNNQFTWFPIQEVGYLFAGIFMTIIPALAILKAGSHGALAPLIAFASAPAEYFWITGGLSSFLDNAPTYLTFFNTALGAFYEGMPEPQAVPLLISENARYLLAISCGAVFMGAVTYIGNAPNFMVKSISEEAGVPMPSFFGYMIKYSLPFLIPVFILVTLVFFR
jgi:Na+/H+ antiporter NhaD/arsenite permease-like protein